jgi:uncharacterized protein (TIGR02058 family)
MVRKMEQYKRYVIEIGTGIDLHGGDLTKAARKAVKAAVASCCLCGIHEILGIEDMAKKMKVEVLLGAVEPEAIDLDQIAKEVPFGQVHVKAVTGGLEANGLHVPSLGEGNKIQIVNAVLTVFIACESSC